MSHISVLDARVTGPLAIAVASMDWLALVAEMMNEAAA